MVLDILSGGENMAKHWLHKLKQSNRSVVIFTTGSVAKSRFRILQQEGIVVDAFVDNDSKKVGGTCCGLPIISFQALLACYRDAYIILASRLYLEAIFEQLTTAGFLQEQISTVDFSFYEMSQQLPKHLAQHAARYEKAFDLLADERSKEVFIQRLRFLETLDNTWIMKIKEKHVMYFDQSLMRFRNKEVIVDGGAYLGDTLEQARALGIDYAAYHAFEPDAGSCSQAMQRYGVDEKVQFYQKGLWSYDGRLNFAASNDGGSMFCETGNGQVAVAAIDNLNICPTFIKMDIEGAEMAALRGAERSLREHAPKLAICVYHKLEDLFEIPLFLHACQPDYRIYLRHYGNGATDTVCYAISGGTL